MLYLLSILLVGKSGIKISYFDRFSVYLVRFREKISFFDLNKHQFGLGR
jgi:hypothetical protein